MTEHGLRNGVVHEKQRRAFPLRLVSTSLPGRLELAVAVFVVATVFTVAFLIFNMPGPLVVQVHDDSGQALMGSRVICSDAAGSKQFDGITDIFGEAKWPGLAKGLWSCRALPPDRFQNTEQDGSATVRSRSPAIVAIRFDRPLHVNVSLKRPHGSGRAKMAVRAVCPATQTAAATGWESRTTVISSTGVLWLPFGRACQVGLVKPSATYGLAVNAPLACDQFPCSQIFSGPSGANIDISLEPTAEQWEAARPPIEPELDVPAKP